jgi:hypothetical protein
MSLKLNDTELRQSMRVGHEIRMRLEDIDTNQIGRWISEIHQDMKPYLENSVYDYGCILMEVPEFHVCYELWLYIEAEDKFKLVDFSSLERGMKLFTRDGRRKVLQGFL